jgi:hypothetical protein
MILVLRWGGWTELPQGICWLATEARFKEWEYPPQLVIEQFDLYSLQPP